jgi:2-keto-4-pentenoate hydratase
MITELTASQAEETARLLLQARRTGTTLPHLPDQLRPTSQAEAHRVQDAILANLGPVGGWKIFASDDPMPFLSPIPQSLVRDQPARLPRGPLPIVLAELEIALVLGKDLPAHGGTCTAEAAQDAIASLHPVLEIITFSWTDRDKVDRLSQLGDLQNSAGFVVGDALADWTGFDPMSALCTLIVDDVEQARSAAGASMPTIVATLANLAGHAAARGLPLSKGQVISTGARVVASTVAATTVRGEVTGLGSVSLSLT